MASRSRRRRFNTDEGDEQTIKQQTKVKIKFAEEIDYKMQIDESETKPKQTKILNEQPSQNEKREAFKKKLRKFSNMMVEGNYMELP